MSAQDPDTANKYKLLIDAILWKKDNPSKEDYLDQYNYDRFIFKQAKRFLPNEFTSLLEDGMDSAGRPTGKFTEESKARFVDEVWRNKGNRILIDLTNPAMAPIEPTSAIEEFDRAKSQEEVLTSEKKKEVKEAEHQETLSEGHSALPEAQTASESVQMGNTVIMPATNLPPGSVPDALKPKQTVPLNGEQAEQPLKFSEKLRKIRQPFGVRLRRGQKTPDTAKENEPLTPSKKIEEQAKVVVEAKKKSESVSGPLHPVNVSPIETSSKTLPAAKPAAQGIPLKSAGPVFLPAVGVTGPVLAKNSAPLPIPQTTKMAAPQVPTFGSPKLKPIGLTPLPKPGTIISRISAIPSFFLPRKTNPLASRPVPPAVKGLENDLAIGAHNAAARIPTRVKLAGAAGAVVGGAFLGFPGIIAGAFTGGFISYYLFRLRITTTYSEYSQYEDGNDEQSGNTYYNQPNYRSGGGRSNPLTNLGKRAGKKIASKLLKKAVTKIGEEAAAAIAANPEIWVPALIIIAIILLLLIFGPKISELLSTCPPWQVGCGATGVTVGNPANNSLVVITKTGPSEVANGQDIPYVITATNQGTQTSNVDITDQIPQDTQFKEASDGVTPQGGIVTWHIASLAPGASKQVQLTITPTKPDIWVVNVANGTGAAIGGTGSGSNVQFDQLMGNGNGSKNPSGSLSNFLSTVFKNGGSFGLQNNPTTNAELTNLYTSATDQNLNPMAVLTIWGVEQGFQLNDPVFGCLSDPPSVGYYAQLGCSVNTLSFWVNDFNKNSKGGSITIPGTSCTYTDPFLYAYEKYTPVCATNDGNSSSRGNFVNIYNTLVGG